MHHKQYAVFTIYHQIFMRIITGKLKGRKINIPKDIDVRPTSDRIKESVFNKIEVYKYLQNSEVLDLFCGSGNLGLEALSRGAKHVNFVDINQKNIQLIQKAATQFDVIQQIETNVIDAVKYLEGPALSYDFIFCDPPYHYPFFDDIVEFIFSNNWLKKEGWLILEHDKSINFEEHEYCFFNKSYGRTTISIFEQTDTK